MDNSEKLIELVSCILRISPKSIDEDCNQDNAKDWDSMVTVSLVTELEAVFGVQFDILEISEFNSVNNIKNALIRKGIKFT